jgi:hypothetical protein
LGENDSVKIFIDIVAGASLKIKLKWSIACSALVIARIASAGLAIDGAGFAKAIRIVVAIRADSAWLEDSVRVVGISGCIEHEAVSASYTNILFICLLASGLAGGVYYP